MSTLTVTTAGLNLVRDNLLGVSSAPPIDITWVAIGTGTQGSPGSATQLANEVFRKQLTNAVAGGSAGEGLFNGYLAPTDSTGTAISEVGFFAGNASSAANSGTLMFYGLYSHTHTSSESIQLQADSTGA